MAEKPQQKQEERRQCRFCEKITTRHNIKAHTLTHFYERIRKEHPEVDGRKPLDCPMCDYKEVRDKLTLLRHFVFKHKYISK